MSFLALSASRRFGSVAWPRLAQVEKAGGLVVRDAHKVWRVGWRPQALPGRLHNRVKETSNDEEHDNKYVSSMRVAVAACAGPLRLSQTAAGQQVRQGVAKGATERSTRLRVEEILGHPWQGKKDGQQMSVFRSSELFTGEQNHFRKIQQKLLRLGTGFCRPAEGLGIRPSRVRIR